MSQYTDKQCAAIKENCKVLAGVAVSNVSVSAKRQSFLICPYINSKLLFFVNQQTKALKTTFY
jgi:hypothetical protein